MNKTSKLGFNIFLETDAVDFEDINENWRKLDEMTLCTKSGVKTASYEHGMASAAKWYYKIYSDGTLEMSAKLDYNSSRMQCNVGTSAPFISGQSIVYFPFEFKEVYDVQMHLSSNTRGRIINTNGNTVQNSVKLIFESNEKENTDQYKQVFISVKGVVV